VKYLKYLAIAYIALLIGLFLSLFFLGNERLEVGCYISNALVIGGECTGFHGSAVASFILNMPLALFYGPLFGIYGLFERPFFASSLYALFTGIALWVPIVFLIYQVKHDKNT